MKKKLLFTFACVMALMAGFVSCTNDDFEEFAPVAEMQKSAMTRAVGGMTQEEVQARLDELGEKYGININMIYVRDYSEFTESSFEKMEQNIIAYKDRELNATVVSAMAVDDNLLDDSVIDEYGIATLSTNVEASQNYDATLNFDVECKVPSKYSTDGNFVLYYQYDDYSYRYGINIKEVEDNVFVNSYLTDLSNDLNKSGQSKKSTCNVGGFRHDTISRNYTGGYSFDFEFELYVHYVKYIEYPFNPINMTTVGFVNGEYDNGIKYIWSMASDYNLTVSFPDLN